MQNRGNHIALDTVDSPTIWHCSKQPMCREGAPSAEPRR
jgi:hypothetical protein